MVVMPGNLAVAGALRHIDRLTNAGRTAGTRQVVQHGGRLPGFQAADGDEPEAVVVVPAKDFDHAGPFKLRQKPLVFREEPPEC